MIRSATRRLRRALGPDPQRGAMSLLFAVVAVVVIVLVALIADGAGKLRAVSKSEATAQEAARSGAQAINVGSAIAGNGIVIDREAALRAARSYLASAGVSGTADLSEDRRSIVVTVTATYRPVILPGATWSVTGHGSAALVVQGG
ncbi:pilus assembly protein TadG-related protein [Kitasatospora sp. NPDC056783]|uniref:pilus assembly protein TadG-related protein n=1 Tax=Kitasatospora sp. NPDC056783 TaxID=3345943 RepID=UPI0036B1FFB3